MTRWNHVHSLASGALLLALVERNGWLLLAGAVFLFAAGWLAHAARDRIGHALTKGGAVMAAQTRLLEERRREVRDRRVLAKQRRRTLRRDLATAEDRGYWRGVRDATP